MKTFVILTHFSTIHCLSLSNSDIEQGNVQKSVDLKILRLIHNRDSKLINAFSSVQITKYCQIFGDFRQSASKKQEKKKQTLQKKQAKATPTELLDS
jgi:hypothetical protein